MNITLMNYYNSIVTNADTVYFLGDFAFAGTKKIAEILRELKGNKILILGNHDYQVKAARWKELGFKEVYNSFTLEHNGFIFKMSHFPWKGSAHDKRNYTQLEKDMSKGTFLLHGHVHNTWKTKYNMINVGVDVWGLKPVSLDTIIEMATEWTDSNFEYVDGVFENKA